MSEIEVNKDKKLICLKSNDDIDLNECKSCIYHKPHTVREKEDLEFIDCSFSAFQLLL